MADDRSITITWTVGDVESIRPDLTPDQCYEVLLSAQRNHDADRGITWDILDGIAAYKFGPCPLEFWEDAAPVTPDGWGRVDPDTGGEG